MLFAVFSLSGQELQKLATKGAVRLFADPEDLSSVIQIIPDETVVEAMSADTLFTLVRLDGLQGYIKSSSLTASLPAVTSDQTRTPLPEQVPETTVTEKVQRQIPTDRFRMLTEKYGGELAKSLYQHKVWKGITSEMALESWGSPHHINRMIVSRSIEEEWIYSRSYLYFRDGILVEWGPVR